MSDVEIVAGPFRFEARFESQAAPKSCEALRRMLPMTSKVIHVRWSGESVWVPMGETGLQVPPENATSYPHPGQILLYPGGISETEILIPYGPCHFASKAGTLAGNHCLTLTSGLELLAELGRSTLWRGAQDITIRLGE